MRVVPTARTCPVLTQTGLLRTPSWTACSCSTSSLSLSTCGSVRITTSYSISPGICLSFPRSSRGNRTLIRRKRQSLCPPTGHRDARTGERFTDSIWFRRHAQDAFAVAEVVCIRDLRQSLPPKTTSTYSNPHLAQQSFGAHSCDHNLGGLVYI